MCSHVLMVAMCSQWWHVCVLMHVMCSHGSLCVLMLCVLMVACCVFSCMLCVLNMVVCSHGSMCSRVVCSHGQFSCCHVFSW